MCVQALLILAAGLMPGADQPQIEGAKPKDWPYYAKVEVQGWIQTASDVRWEPMYIFVPAPDMKDARIPVDLSNLKGWTVDKLRRANGKDVRVTGTLELKPVGIRPGVTEDRLVIVAKTLEVTEDDKAPARKRP